MIEINPVMELAIRLAIAMLFLGSVAHKLRSPMEFAGTVEAYLRGVPFVTETIKWIAVAAIVAMEAAVVMFCVLPGPAFLAGGGATAILLLYAVAMGTNIARGNVLLDCGCALAAAQQPVSKALVLRNLVLATISALLLMPSSEQAAEVFEIVNAVIFAGFLLLIYEVSNQLILNAQKMKVNWI